MDRSKWDNWLAFMVADLKCEYEQEIDISNNEDTFTDLEFDMQLREECDE